MISHYEGYVYNPDMSGLAKDKEKLEARVKELEKELREVAKQSLEFIQKLQSENSSLKQRLEISQYQEDDGNWFLRGYEEDK